MLLMPRRGDKLLKASFVSANLVMFWALSFCAVAILECKLCGPEPIFR